MGYIEDNLVRGEEIIFTTRLHWWVIMGHGIQGFLVVILLGICGMPSTISASTADSDFAGTYAAVLACISGILALAAAFFGYLAFISSEFGLTNRRLMIKTGVLRRRTLELNLRQVEGFQADEPILGRILGFQNVTVTGSGGTKQKFGAVANGTQFRKRVIEYSTEAQER
jgi:uncharacterized membrane protein YdbT with pleckstrin-like domain